MHRKKTERISVKKVGHLPQLRRIRAELLRSLRRRRKAKGTVIIVRYAADFVLGFQNPEEAELCRRELAQRMEQFGLELKSEPPFVALFGYGQDARVSAPDMGGI